MTYSAPSRSFMSAPFKNTNKSRIGREARHCVKGFDPESLTTAPISISFSSRGDKHDEGMVSPEFLAILFGGSSACDK